MRFLNQRVEIGQRAENRIDITIIGNVIAEILHRRLEEGREPHGIDSKRSHIVELVGDAGQIADAVTIAVGEAARIDLIDRRAAPPRSIVFRFNAVLGQRSFISLRK